MNEFEIILYKNGSEPNRLDKSGYLSKIIALSGTIKNTTSIINPTIIFEFPMKIEKVVDSDNNIVFDNDNKLVIISNDIELKLLNSNYCYIEKFGRYYYINDIISIRSGLWELSMSCDVLMSFKEEIRKQYVLVARNEFRYNNMLVDNMVGSEYDKEIITTSGFGVVTFNLDSERSIDVKLKMFEPTYLISTCADASLVVNSYGYQSNSTLLFSTDRNGFNIFNEAILDSNLFTSIGTWISNWFQSPSDTVISMAYLPINPIKFDLQANIIPVPKLEIGNTYIPNQPPSGLQPNYRYLSGLPYFITFCKYNENNEVIGMTISDKYDNFLDYLPYTSIELFLPFIGWVDIDPIMLYDENGDKPFFITYIVDPLSGEFNAVLHYNYDFLGFNGREARDYLQTVAQYIWSGSLYCKLPVGSSNIGQVASSIIRTIGHIATKGSTLAIEHKYQKDKISRMRDYKKKPSKKKLEAIEREKASFKENIINLGSSTMDELLSNTPQLHGGSGISGNSYFGMDDEVIIRISRVKPIYPPNYNHFFGKPCNETDYISNFHGFTIVDECNLEHIDNALVQEVEEIEDILTSGVLLPLP